MNVIRGGHPRRVLRGGHRRALAVTAGLAVLVAGSGLALALARAPSQAGSPADSLLPPRGVLFGAAVQPTDGFSTADREAATTAFERTIGRRLAIVSLYMRWPDPMPVALAAWDLRGRRIPMISWDGISSAEVIAGLYDSQLRHAAEQLESLHGPVLLRYMPEMNDASVAKFAGSPATFIAAWRHVYGIFRNAGASNVQWVWCPTSLGFAGGGAQAFYPGENYVNWIGADGYNWAPGLPGARWRSFAAIFNAFYLWADGQPKPLLIGEFGTCEGLRGAKARWFSQAGGELHMLFPRIRAVVYFSSVGMDFGLRFDWRADSSQSALAAFRALVRDPYLSARPIT
jgi:hypothetical protein